MLLGTHKRLPVKTDPICQALTEDPTMQLLSPPSPKVEVSRSQRPCTFW